MRTLTLLFFAVVSLLLGGIAVVPAQTIIGAGILRGDSMGVAWQVYGDLLVIVGIAAPVGFLAAAVAAALRHQ
ncbi:MAG: hypothetical protein ACYDAN_10880 [Candidatus Limnocylindrales bacterium]